MFRRILLRDIRISMMSLGLHKNNFLVLIQGEYFVNAGPAVYISPSGPNPLMVQTAAFALPTLDRLFYRPKSRPAIRVLILTPTRELVVRYQLASIDQMRGSNVASLAAMEQTRNNDPKFQIPRVSSSIPNNSLSINQRSPSESNNNSVSYDKSTKTTEPESSKKHKRTIQN
ncbi:hypothetical protein OROHE_006068 [Orobanche hederae]